MQLEGMMLQRLPFGPPAAGYGHKSSHKVPRFDDRSPRHGLLYGKGRTGAYRSDKAAFSYKIELDTDPGPVPINGCYVIPVLACCSATGAEIVLYIV